MGAEVEVRVRIVLREWGGLGNQLFQYAALAYYARRYSADMHIAADPDWNAQCNGYPEAMPALALPGSGPGGGALAVRSLSYDR